MGNVFKAVIIVFVFLVGSFLVGGWMASGYVMSSPAMAPAIEEGEVCFINRMAGGNPRRGDVVLIQVPEEETQVVRRVIALERETVELRGGEVYIGDAKLDEPWLTVREVETEFEQTEPDYYGPEIVPIGYVFVLGDHRAASVDSRSFGVVSRDRIRGRVWSLFGPLTF